MSLIVCVDDPAFHSDAEGKHFFKAAGFASYRTELWGRVPIAWRSPLLAQIEHDLHLLPSDFEEFETQCRRVDAEAEAIARELRWDEATGTKSIRQYMRNFLDAVEFARMHNSPSITTIW